MNETTIVDALKHGHLDLAQIGGFTDGELAGAKEAARVYLERGEPAKALGIASLLVALKPHDAATYRIAGVAALQLEQPLLAQSLFEMASARDPANMLTQLCLAEAKMANGALAEALTLFAAAIPRVGPELAAHGRRARELVARIEASLQSMNPTANKRSA